MSEGQGKDRELYLVNWLATPRFVWVAMVLLLLVDTNFKHNLTDLRLSKQIMRVLIFRDVSKLSGVNTPDSYITKW